MELDGRCWTLKIPMCLSNMCAVEATRRDSPGAAKCRDCCRGLLTSSWGSTTGTHLKIRREVSPTVTQRFSLWDKGE